MRLFLIDKPGCHHIKDIMPSIMAVYQMEQEFYPYLTVEFVPHRDHQKPGIILLAGQETIRRYYTFDNPNDIKNLRKLLWKYLLKYHNIKKMKEDKNGCLKEIRHDQTNRVIQGWQAKKREMTKEICCKGVKKIYANALSDLLETQEKEMDEKIKHPVYRVDTTNKIDRNICKKIRWEECGNNYAPNSAEHIRCVDQVNYLCNHGYPKNKLVNKVTAVRKKLKAHVLDYLKKNNFRANRKMFDLIFSAGFFEHAFTRAGNKYTEYGSKEHAINDALNENQYFEQLIEGFDINSDPNNCSRLSIIVLMGVFLFLIYTLYRI